MPISLRNNGSTRDDPRYRLAGRSRYRLLLLTVVSISLFGLGCLTYRHGPVVSSTALSISDAGRGIRIAVYEGSGFHDDVAGALIYTAERSGATVTSYRTHLRVSPDYPGGWRFGFGKILSAFHDGPTISAPPNSVDSLESSISRAEFDVLIIVSCDQRWLEDSLRTVLAQPSDLQVVCMHHEENGFHAHHEPFHNLAREGRIQFVSLGAHTSRMYAEHLTQWSTRDRNTGWAVHPVQTLVTVRPRSRSPEREGKESKAHEEGPSTVPPPARLSLVFVLDKKKNRRTGCDNAVIMGDLTYGRRHFDRIFTDLESEIIQDPSAWGYRYDPALKTLTPLDLESEPTSTSTSAFKLHILGSDKGKVPIPSLLVSGNVVQIHSHTTYEEYYSILGRMDLAIPAWIDNEYWAKRASASISAAINAKVPTLVYRAIIDAYPYLHPVAYVLHTAGESEMKSVLRLRLRTTPPSNLKSHNDDDDGSGSKSRSVDEDDAHPPGITPSWTGSIPASADWDEYHLVLDRWNLDNLERVLHRVKPQSEAGRLVL
ncbi:hypothetical protein FFLO_05697 [Filobasidium floriforme]|uniref:Uncharacterized protein n=1 Tax=Filobasidium floriforme TaxID=5210 RepID=A0A8K0JGX0_9TREE|nr:uncharacterized protein HD553DRAFT_345733 [Filobasidium floriforme]KAG7529382.1 hypothetical protein FFLO_05697 [Filobasidium floriforme]KAH8079387.1 hypothetical protein HD553DRAFT_345733 [Filobasidium floriforme]